MKALIAVSLALGVLFFAGKQVFSSSAQPAVAQPAAASPSPSPKRLVTLAITQMPSPNQDERPSGMAIDTLLIHDTETPGVQKARTIANHFCNPRSEASSHYIIGKAGEIIQCVPDEKRAWHAGPSHYQGREKVNNFSIGIELVNAQTGRDPFTDAQYRSLIALSADLVSRHRIPLERIVGHRAVTDYPAYRKDPADNFDWKRYLDGLKQTLATCEVRRDVAEAALPR